MRRRAVIAALLALALGAGRAAALPDTACSGMRFAEPTAAYGHGVLGAQGEWRAIELTREAITLGGGSREVVLTFRLPEAAVFEDVALRCVDLDGHGLRELVVVESDVAQGAQLAVYGADVRGNRTEFRKIAATPHIGRRHRWLAPVGIADFDGNGSLDIAYVETPHLGGTLRVWSFAAGGLTELAAMPGFSNHRIGEDFITGGVRDCGQGAEMILPDFQWRAVMKVRMVDGALRAERVPGGVSRALVARLLACGEGRS